MAARWHVLLSVDKYPKDGSPMGISRESSGFLDKVLRQGTGLLHDSWTTRRTIR